MSGSYHRVSRNTSGDDSPVVGTLPLLGSAHAADSEASLDHAVPTAAGEERVVLGSFALRGQLGEGAFATAYLAEQIGMGREAVVKIAHPHLIHGADGALIRKRFDVEVRASARVNHPNITVVYTSGEVDGLPALAMEYVRGVTMDRWLTERIRLNEEELVLVFGQLASALQALHGVGITHRDVSPANIIVNLDRAELPVPKLLDFGIAAFDEQRVRSNAPVGTPFFMAPEQMFGEHSPASDIFSLGALMWRACTGGLFLDGERKIGALFKRLQQLDGTASPLDVRPDLNPNLARLVQRMLHPDPSQRPDAAHVGSTLAHLSAPDMSGELYNVRSLTNTGELTAHTDQLVTPSTADWGMIRSTGSFRRTPSMVRSLNVPRTLICEEFTAPLAMLDQVLGQEHPNHVRTSLGANTLREMDLRDFDVVLIPLLDARKHTARWVNQARVMLDTARVDACVHVYSDQPVLDHAWVHMGADAVWRLPFDGDAMRDALFTLKCKARALADSSSITEDAHLFEEMAEELVGSMPEWILELEDLLDASDRRKLLALGSLINSHALGIGARHLARLMQELLQIPTIRYKTDGARLLGELMHEYSGLFQDISLSRTSSYAQR